MVTKSKSDRSIFWSLFAIAIAIISIGYCFSHITELIGNGVDRSSRAVAYLTRLIRGGTL